MTVKLFILGLPGSGKTTVASYISKFAKNGQRSTIHFNDYDILYRMSRADTQSQFRKIDGNYKGFDVLDFAVFDTALKKLEQIVNDYLSRPHFEDLALIEFARNDYEHAFRQFNLEFLQHAYFLYLKVNQRMCIERVHKRIDKQPPFYGHFVSDHIFETYYTGDDGERLSEILPEKFGIDKDKVEFIYNDGIQEDLSTFVKLFVDEVILL